MTESNIDTAADLICPTCGCAFPADRLAGLTAHVQRAHGHDGDVRVVGGRVELVTYALNRMPVEARIGPGVFGATVIGDADLAIVRRDRLQAGPRAGRQKRRAS